MLLVVDVGNTNISFGVFSERALLHHVRCESARARTADEYAVLIRQMLALRGVDPAGIDSAIIASVVPPLTDTMVEFVRRAFRREALVVGPGGSAFMPRGSIHTFKNVGDQALRLLIITTPAGMEKFFCSCHEEFAKAGGPDMSRVLQISEEHGIHFLEH